MKLSELMQELRELETQFEHAGIDPEVRGAYQPSWPFETRIGPVVSSEDLDDSEEVAREIGRMTPEERSEYEAMLEEEGTEDREPVVWIACGSQLGYLAEDVKAAMQQQGWSE